MTWTAPDITRHRVPPTGDERTLLEAFLDFHRETLLRKCAGLTADQLRQTAVDPSDLSLLGLVRHMDNVERGWFWDFAGEMSFRHTTAGETTDPTAQWNDFSGVAEADPAADLDGYQQTCQRARELVAGTSLDDTHTDERDQTFSLRWIYLHMIEEYARHNGHADLLRERIDGTTGQ